MDGGSCVGMLMGACVELAEVTAIDPGDGRITVRLLSSRTADGGFVETPALIAVPFAGVGYGALFIPAVGERVIVSFLDGDPRHPVVIGAVWHGTAAPPTSPGDADTTRYGLYTPRGNSLEIEESGGGTITLETTAGQSIVLEENGSRITLKTGGSTVRLSAGSVTIETGTVEINGAQVKVTAPAVDVEAAISTFSGVISCDVLITNTVIASTYTPGAGNVW